MTFFCTKLDAIDHLWKKKKCSEDRGAQFENHCRRYLTGRQNTCRTRAPPAVWSWVQYLLRLWSVQRRRERTISDAVRRRPISLPSSVLWTGATTVRQNPRRHWPLFIVSNDPLPVHRPRDGDWKIHSSKPSRQRDTIVTRFCDGDAR